MTRTVDPNFVSYFDGRLQQVFLYLNDECNLRCSYCLYKANLAFALKEIEIPLAHVLNLIEDFRQFGASKLTLMGGEPTLYGAKDDWASLLKIIEHAKQLGYEYVRIDTNGTFNSALLEKDGFKKVDEVTFSLDSHLADFNDAMRGQGVFDKCVANIQRAVAAGYNVNITSCVHKANIGHDDGGDLVLHKTILFAESLGVSRINFHPIFKMGIPRDTWIDDSDISPQEWLRVFHKIQDNIEQGIYHIPVRIPRRFISRQEFEADADYHGFCPVKLGERVLVHPNGQIRICALMIGTPHAIGWYGKDRLGWNETLENETRNHCFEQASPCANQRKFFGRDMVPLCISFKEKQDEFVYEKKLAWELRRRDSGD